MSHQQIEIPKKIVYHLIASVFLLMVIGGGLFLFLHLETIETTLGLETPFLDLNKQGNLLNWLFVTLWLIVAVEATVIISITRENNMGIFYELFWGNVVVLALLISANTLCNFTPALQHLLEATFARFQLTGDLLWVAYILAIYGPIAFLSVEAFFCFRYVGSQQFARVWPSLSFFFCIGLFFPVVYYDGKLPEQRFIMLIQMPQQLALSQEQDNVSPATTPKMEKQKTENTPEPIPTRGTAPAKSPAGLIVQDASQIIPPTDTNKNANRQYRNVSGELTDFQSGNLRYSSSNSSDNQNIRLTVNAETSTEKANDKKIYWNNWKQIFFHTVSLGQKSGFDQSFESDTDMPDPIVSNLSAWVGKNIVLDSARVAFHYGCYGLFLSCVVFTLGLIIRGGKIQIDKKFQSQVINMRQMSRFLESLNH